MFLKMLCDENMFLGNLGNEFHSILILLNWQFWFLFANSIQIQFMFYIHLTDAAAGAQIHTDAAFKSCWIIFMRKHIDEIISKVHLVRIK